MANQTTGLTATVSPAPLITDIADAVGPFPGTIPTRGQTNDTHPTVSGIGVAGDTITLYQNGVVCGQSTVAANGTWSIMVSGGLSLGAHDMTATQTAPGQSESAASNHWPISVLASTQSIPVMNVPTDDSGAPITGTTADTHPIFSGTGTAGDLITVYDAGRPIASVTVKGDGTWSVKPATELSNGTHDIYAVETNSAGTPSVPSNHASIVIDTTPPPVVGAPAAPVIADVVAATGQFPGTVPPRGITDDTHPTISGTGIPGYTISVFQNGSVCGQTTVGADGTWSIRIPGAMSGGIHDMTATQSAPGTVESSVSNHWSITIAINVPATPAAPTLTDDSGASIAAGSTTADAHPHINGQGTAGDTITVYDNGKAIGSTTVKPDGTWSFTPSPDLGSGSHDITTTETNAAGTPSLPSNPTHITIDTSVPAKPPVPVLTDDSGASIPAGSTTNDGHPHISGTGKAGDIITVYDGATVLGSVKIGSDGKWTFTPSSDVATGAHSISVTDTNAAGTTGPKSDAIAFNFSLVAGAPVITSVVDAVGAITGVVPSGGVTDDNHPTISGTGVAGYTIYIYQNGAGCGDVKVDATGHWSLKLTGALSDGLHVMTATQFIGSNPQSASSNSWNITVDTSVPAAPPTPTLTNDSGASIPAGSTTNDGHPHISGTGKAGDTITVYDGSTILGTAKVDSTGKWTFTPSSDLSNSTHSISVTDTNAAGTVSPKSGSISFTVDSGLPNAPTITLMNDWRFDNGVLIAAVPSGSTIASANVSFGGQATANGVVYVYDGNTMIASVKADATGYWFYTSKAYTNGLHDMSATQKSPAGVETAHSNHWTFTLNAVTPATPGVPVITNDAGAAIPSGSTTNDAHPHIAGTGTAGDVITVLDNGKVIGSTTVAGNGTWSFTPATDLANGATAITVQETNPAGNASAVSPPATFTIDTSVPAKPPVPVLTDDSGASIPAGSTTNDGHPHISGTGKAGDIITVYDGSTVLGSVKIGGDGKWTFTPSSDVSTGAHSISVTDTNAAGTTGPKSDAIAFNFSLVAGAPVITSVVDAVGAITGPIPNGGVTDDPRPTFNGTGVPGYTIYVFSNGAGVGDTVVKSDGTWSIRVDKNLGNGLNAMTVTQFITGNPQSAAATWALNVDTSVPKTPTAPTMTDDSGAAIAAGSTTADAHPHINGNGTAGDTITVYDGGKAIGSTTVKPDGTWSFTPSPDLSPGAHDITTTETNAAGTPSLPSNPTHITIDTSVPAKPPVPVLTDDSGALIPAGSTTNDGHPHISGTGKAGDIITVYDGSTVLGSVKIGSDGKWTFTPSSDVATGAHSISVTDTNAAGTTGPKSDAIAFNFSLVAGAPVITSVVDAVGAITGVVPSGGVTDDNHPTISGTGVPGYTIYIYQNGAGWGDVKVDASGHWSLKLTGALSDGLHVITATQFIGSNPQSASSNSWNITVDTSVPKTPAAPTLTDDSGAAIAAGSTTADAHPHINGNGTAGDTITVYDGGKAIGSTTVKPDGTWSFTPSPDLSPGAHDITTTETNAAGTPSQPSNPIHVVIDTSVPAKPPVPVLTDDSGALIPAGSTTNDGHPHISGTGTAGDIIKVYDGSTVLGSVKIGSDGKWTFTPSSDLSEGAHSINVTDTNAAGTTGPHSDSIAFNLSLVPGAPVITALADATGPNVGNIAPGGLATDSQPTIKGTGHAGDTIKVYDGATLLGSATVGSDGTWTFKPAKALAYGAHSLTATESNASGTSVASAAYAFRNTGIMITGMTDHNGNAIANGGSTDGEIIVTGWIDSANAPLGLKVLLSGGTIGSIQSIVSPDFTIVGNVITLKINTKMTDSIHTVGPGTYTIDFQGGAGALTYNFPGGGLTWSVTDSFTFPGIPSTPAVPVLTDDSGAVIPAGSITADGHPHISGKGTAGDIITVYDGAAVLGSVKIGSDGKWTFTPSSDLSNATHSINVTEANAAGTSPHSGAISFTVNTSVPAKPPVPVLTDDSGALIPAGSTTNDGHPHISGTGTAGDIIKVYDGSTVLGSVKIGSDGKWTFTPSYDVSIGAHSISVTDTNAAGTTGPKSDAIAFTFSLVPPAPVITSVIDAVGTITGPIPNGGVTDDPKPTFHGTGIAGDTIYLYSNGRGCGDTVVKADGTWTIQINNYLTAGVNVMTATQFIGGNPQSAASNPWTFTLDTSVPAAPPTPILTNDIGALIPAGSTTNNGRPHIYGTGTAGDIITVYDGSTVLGSVKADSNGNWLFMPSSDLSNTTHSISATDTNAAGTTSAKSGSISFTIGQAPTETVTISGVYDDTTGFLVLVSPGGTTKDTTPIVQGTVDHSLLSGESLVVYRDGVKVGTAVMSGTSWWINDEGVSVGSHTYTARVENTVGNGAYSAGYSFTEAAPAPPVPTYRVISGKIGLVSPGAYTAFQMEIDKVTVIDNNGRTCPVSVEVYDTYGNYYTHGNMSGYTFIPSNMNKPYVASYIYAVVYRPDDGSAPFYVDVHTGTQLADIWKSNKFNGTYYFTGDNTMLSSVTLKFPFKATRMVQTDDAGSEEALAATVTTDAADTAPHHTTVTEHDAFKGTTGHDTVDLNADPTSYFKETTAHIEGSTVHPMDTTTGTATAVNTLHLTGDHQVLDLTSLTGKTAAAKISGIEAIDLGGQHNTLKLSLVDVLNLGEADLFMKDGKQQMMVQGKEGDEVDLSNAHIAGVADGQWEAHGTAQVGGVTYNVYEHSGAHTELLVQQGVQIVVH